MTTLTIHPTYAYALMEETKRKIKVLAKEGLSHLGIDYRKIKRNLLHKRRSQA